MFNILTYNDTPLCSQNYLTATFPGKLGLAGTRVEVLATLVGVAGTACVWVANCPEAVAIDAFALGCELPASGAPLPAGSSVCLAAPPDEGEAAGLCAPPALELPGACAVRAVDTGGLKLNSSTAMFRELNWLESVAIDACLLCCGLPASGAPLTASGAPLPADSGTFFATGPDEDGAALGATMTFAACAVSFGCRAACPSMRGPCAAPVDVLGLGV